METALKGFFNIASAIGYFPLPHIFRDLGLAKRSSHPCVQGRRFEIPRFQQAAGMPFLLAALLAQANVKAQTDVEAQSNNYVGSTSCQGCHEQTFAQWQGSHHQLAMQPADGASVLGDFSEQTFENAAGRTRFFMDGDRYWVSTEGADSQPKKFIVTHTFGFYPLQQYLLDAGGGRKQALNIAWDARPEQDGGQRWFDLNASEPVSPGDPLHWTGPLFNWNGMCAECHSTDVRVNYDAASDTFDTRYAEVSVGCEACHGPGARHITQAQTDLFDASLGLSLSLDDQADARWTINPDSGIAQRSSPATSQQQTQSCGRCHARRSPLTTDYEFGQHLADTHLPALLEENLYFSDGAIFDEVYVYGSFLQSAMHRAGVTCSNCHNPHSAELKTPGQPNGVCAQCHLPAKFAVATHPGDQPGMKGNCVECHMKSRTYMGVDDRRDHSFRIPDAGNRPGHFGPVFAAARAAPGAPSGIAELARLAGDTNTPGIARATALSMLDPSLTRDGLSAVAKGLQEPDPLLRIGALQALTRLPERQRVALGSELLSDPVLGVRVRAAQLLAADSGLLSAAAAVALRTAAAEARVGLTMNLFVPGNALSLAEFESRLGNPDAAEQAFKHALKLDPKMALAHHAYGLFLVRNARLPEAMAALAKAADLAPDNPRLVYVYGVALNSVGQSAAALALLSKAQLTFPEYFDIGWALATMQRDAGQRVAARSTALKLASRFPGNANVQALLRSLPAARP